MSEGTKSIPAERVHPTVDMTKVGKVMRKLHDQVCGDRKRVEITRAGCDDVCVMISKKELESLEQAFAVLTDTDTFLATCDQIKKLIARAGMVHGPVPVPENEPETVGA